MPEFYPSLTLPGAGREMPEDGQAPTTGKKYFAEYPCEN